MNKILLATTALVATAGVASAEVSLSGWAEMGLIGGDAYPTTQFHTGVDVRFTLSGETDGGLTFGATIDLDEATATQSAPGVAPATANQATKAAVFISGSFGTVTMGDTDGALDWAMQETAIGSSIADDHTEHAGYNGNSVLDGAPNGNVLRYDNTFGDFGVAVSAQIDGTGSATIDNTFGLGLKYDVALGGLDLGLGLGYQDNGTNGIVGLSVDTTFANGLRAILNYTDLDSAAVSGLAMDKHVGLGLGYTSGALTVSANYGEYSGVYAAHDRDGFGVAVNYDLGGASVQFGYGSDRSRATITSEESWSLGLAMSF
ncbi:porin [Halocynthiibacter namhaensis]|uniref:porin n=1 Tax=Halocynthiibacter namhaensis TaxID=1290553 RepID=UPI0005798E60|nr:porin [Halocynthiibacter namhaensis]